MDKLKYALIGVGGILTTYFKAYLPLFIIVCIAILFDIFTGVFAAIYTKVGLNSQKARDGAVKKGTMLLSLAFGMFLDYLIPMAAEQIGFTIAPTLAFSSIIAFYIVFTECVSVCENIFKCNPNAFPKWIVKILSDGIKHLDDKVDIDNDKNERSNE